LVLDLNRRAQATIPAVCQVAVVPDATPLFEEPGALEEVAALARDWFVSHLATTGTRGPQGPAEFPNA
jgi:putative phosphoribosyl transferase